MSKNNDNPVIESTAEVISDEIVEKQNFFQKRIVAPIKKHPKITAVVLGGAALVVGAGALGRATAPSNDSEEEYLYFVPTDVTIESDDSTSES